nr:D-alanyl-D-alanine carboxypeptidase [Pseudomonadota bacterium]
ALGLKAGDTISVQDAILALAVKSANNVAVVVAEHISLTEPAFANKMTKKAHELGMKDTTFKNASGWFHKGHKTTAYDMAILLKSLHQRFPQYYKYLGQKSFSFNGEKYTNKNKLLGTYPGLDGGKTGFVSKAGFCLAVSAVRPSGRVVAVVLGEPNKVVRMKHMQKLLDMAFNKIAKIS